MSGRGPQRAPRPVPWGYGCGPGEGGHGLGDGYGRGQGTGDSRIRCLDDSFPAHGHGNGYGYDDRPSGDTYFDWHPELRASTSEYDPYLDLDADEERCARAIQILEDV